MKAVRTLGTVLGFALLVPVSVHAQISPLSLEGRVGAVIPTGDFADGAKTGFGFDVNAAYRVIPTLDIYAGFAWSRFGVEDDEEFDTSVDIDDSGFQVGARLHVPGVPGVDPWVRGGVIFHQVKWNVSEGGLTGSITTDRTVGFEAGGGVAIPVAPRVALTPAVTFRSYKPEFEFFGETADMTVSYVGLHLGARISF
jgi:opacity protein-like surface antigen